MHINAVIGADQYEDDKFILKAWLEDEVWDTIQVPTFYGYHLEHLCYLT